MNVALNSSSLACRSAQDLLCERGALVKERMRDTDAMSRGLLDFYIAEIDRELGRRRAA